MPCRSDARSFPSGGSTGSELGARRRGLGFHRQVAADGARGFLKRGDHVIGELAGHGAAHLGGDVRVTVAVGTDPAARVEERGASGLDETGLIAEDPVVEATVDLGDGVEQRVVEDVENRVGFLNRGRLLQRNRRGAEQGVDLVVETAQSSFLSEPPSSVRLEQSRRCGGSCLPRPCGAPRWGAR